MARLPRPRRRGLPVGSAAVRRGAGSYVHQIEKLLEQANKGIDVVTINRGVSGELAADAAVRIKTEVALMEPNLILWQVGTNDALASVPLDEFEATVTGTVRWLKEHKVDVVLVGLQFVPLMAQDEHYKAVRELLRRIAAQENVIIIRRYEATQFLTRAELVVAESLADELQQMEGGYECLAQYVARAIALNELPAVQPVHSIPRIGRAALGMLKDVLDAYNANDAEKALGASGTKAHDDGFQRHEIRAGIRVTTW